MRLGVVEDPDMLVIEEMASATEIGFRNSVTFGKILRTRLPKLPSRVVTTFTRTIHGELESPIRANVWRYGIGDDFVDDPGRCALDKLPAGAAHLRIRVTVWDDGRRIVRCLGILPPPAPFVDNGSS
jgi:hypothetical protein